MTAIDKAAQNRPKETLESPANNAGAVTPSDSVSLGFVSRALYIGTQGDLKVRTVGGDDVTFVGVQGILPVRVTHVLATGTDASDIVALW